MALSHVVLMSSVVVQSVSGLGVMRVVSVVQNVSGLDVFMSSVSVMAMVLMSSVVQSLSGLGVLMRVVSVGVFQCQGLSDVVRTAGGAMQVKISAPMSPKISAPMSARQKMRTVVYVSSFDLGKKAHQHSALSGLLYGLAVDAESRAGTSGTRRAASSCGERRWGR